MSDAWEQDQIRYSETEVRYALNEVVGEVWALWLWPNIARRFWFQEKVMAVLKSLKPTAHQAVEKKDE